MKKILIGLLLSALLFSLAACGGTGDPSVQPSKDAQPTATESAQPTTSAPTGQPTHAPSTAPTETPTAAPTSNPTAAPTGAPAETAKVTLLSDGNEQIVSVPVGREIGTLPAA